MALTVSHATLWEAYQVSRSPELKNQLAIRYGDLVRFVLKKLQAGKYSGLSVIDAADLEQAGYIGLLDAIERFDPTKGVKFETYAITRIRGSMQDELRTVDWVPRSVRKRKREAEKETADFDMNSERRPLRQQTVESTFTIHRMNRRQEEPHLMTMEPTDFTDTQLLQSEECIAELESNPLESMGIAEARKQLIELIERLDKRERLIVTLYYYEELTFKEIADILRITESRVFQIHAAVLKRFRAEMAEFI